MARHIRFILIVCVFLFPKLQAQDISKLTIPTSPAFSILDFEPSAIMRPTTARGLAADVLNAFDKNGKLLLNLGLEVTPYWLKSHPTLTRETYLRPTVGQGFLQSLSLSAATVKDSVSGDNKLSGGFRFKLMNGQPVKELATVSAELKIETTVLSIINGFMSLIKPGLLDTKQKVIDAIEKALSRSAIPVLVIDDVKNKAGELSNQHGDSITDIKPFLNQLINNREEAYRELAATVSDLLYERKGFILEFAGATGFNTSQNNSVEKVGFWGNASYGVSPDDLFTLTARYMFNDRDTTTNNFDVGLGFLKKNRSYNISLEAMLRHYKAEMHGFNSNNEPISLIEKDFTWRLALQASYAISKDIGINLSFGKNFDSPFISRSAFFSILGLNYSLFSKEPGQLK